MIIHLDEICSRPSNFKAGIARFCPSLATFLNFSCFSINLEGNGLTTFGGLIHLEHLKVLCLNHNHIETLTTKVRLVPCDHMIRCSKIGSFLYLQILTLPITLL